MVLVKTLALALCAALAAGCSTEKVSRKNVPLEQGPLPRFTQVLREYVNPTATAVQREEFVKQIPKLEYDALVHLEEVCEKVATEMIGKTVDFSTPLIHPVSYTVEIGPSLEEKFAITWEYSNSLLALKYLADHTGNKFLDAFPISDTLTAAIDECINDPTSHALTRVRSIERELYQQIGLTMEQVKKNERTIDSEVGMLEGRTTASVVLPFFIVNAQIVFNPKSFLYGKRELIHTYGHELYHAIISQKRGAIQLLFESDPEPSQEQRAIIEQSCEVFGDEFVQHLKAENLPPPHSCKKCLEEFEEKRKRLKRLYFAPKEFNDLLSKRYGHDENNHKAQIAKVMKTIGYDDYTELVAYLSSFEQLRNLAKVCDEEKMDLKLAKELLSR